MNLARLLAGWVRLSQANFLRSGNKLELETVGVLEGEIISLSIPDSISRVGLCVTFQTKSVVITVGIFSSVKSGICVLFNLHHSII